ncbi:MULTISPECIES: ankyrin repeat domain-containing protein [unclassified Streptomyces]|uniref:ankyrin repeat domain-containing protein n=1 Tax=unclassified Streptomyces TaxID=2593676 RepID=UPI001BEB8A03|nr:MULTISPECIES: ankyrin repeat domain-containing protein [unclassified Streptomyces]MBT2407142.1 ankyrin repeat domain-containing protein [Streptomyces sp. ISL-21]MBT2612790.1 ankyrin repeat domain-containing protein [Streptomyces sp. ISL-87]
MNRRTQKRLSRQLVAAAGIGSAGEVAALLRAGAAPGGTDEEGTTGLYTAAVHGAADVVRLLLAHGADPDAESGGPTDGTPLCAAACWGHAEAVRELVAGGADPELREDGGTGMTPLEWARRGGHDEVVRRLRAGGGAAPAADGEDLVSALLRPE